MLVSIGSTHAMWNSVSKYEIFMETFLILQQVERENCLRHIQHHECHTFFKLGTSTKDKSKPE